MRKIHFFKSLALALWLCFLASSVSFAGDNHHIEKIRILGANRTDHSWLKAYLNLKLPAELTDLQLLEFQEKLLTSKVFSAADVSVHGDQLVILVDEKWTLVPVARGAFGGGTPLAVLGAYDIHLAGKLLTLGGEIRKYGDANPGGILYWRNPEWREKFHLGSEIWHNNRIRTLFDSNKNNIGNLITEASIFRVNVLRQWHDSHIPIKYGLDFKIVDEASAEASLLEGVTENGESEDELLSKVPLDLNAQSNLFALASVVFDNMKIENINLDGYRLVLKAGPQVSDGDVQSKTELEGYAFYHLPADLNGVAHGFYGSGSSRSVASQYYLGGFESVRGYVDGVVYGPKAAYGNFELRKLMRSTKYLWFQPTVFYDTGMAGRTWKDAQDKVLSSAGIGMRFTIPQIYRMMIRIDYAWSTDGSGQRGITAGMNQFFQPYRPL